MTTTKKMRIACRRHDWTDALFDGRLKEPALEFIPEGHLGFEALLGAAPAVDFLESALIGFLQQRAHGVAIKALPVFVRASFRHSYIFINKNSGIESPKDLEGKRVAIRYTMSANVWARALLQHDYGVRMEKVGWLNQESAPDVPYNLPPGMTLEPLGEDVDMQDLLAEGEIDALIHPDVVPSKLLARKNVRRLFPRAAEEEKKSYRRTGIIPVMNVVAFREEEFRRQPEIIKSVFGAFRRAKEIGLNAMQDNRRSGLLWYWESLEDQLGLVGEDPAPYSLEKMRHTLNAFIGYAVEQGLLKAPIPLEDLFLTGNEYEG